MSASAGAMPSRKLLVVLALSLLVAAFTVGSSLLGGGSDEDPDEFQEIFDIDEDVGAERIVIDLWEVPENPRDPFLQVELDSADPVADEVDP